MAVELTDAEIWALDPHRPNLTPRDQLVFTRHEREAATAAMRKALWADVALVEKMNRNGTVTAHVDGHDVVLSEYMRDCLLAAGIAPWEAPDA